MDEEKVRAIARAEAEKILDDALFVRHHQIDTIVDSAVKKTLQGFGIDIDDPTSVQENFINLRSWSDLKRTLAQAFVTTLARSVTLGIIALFVMGFYVWITGKTPP